MYELTCYIFINNIYKLKFLSSTLLDELKGSDIKLNEESGEIMVKVDLLKVSI